MTSQGKSYGDYCIIALDELLSSDVIDSVVQLVNDYAKLKVQKNTPARRRSLYTNWKDMKNVSFWKF